MLQSMTGYGKARITINNQDYLIELRSLNSKQADISLRIPNVFRVAEFDIRTLLTQELQRGKIDCTISTISDSNTANAFTPINEAAAIYYGNAIKHIQQALGIEGDVINAVMRFPDVIKLPDNDTLGDTEKQILLNGIKQAVREFNAFRVQEGKALQTMFNEKLDSISALLCQVEPLEKERVERIRERLESSLEQLKQETLTDINQNRLEQEMIYYLEKLDITEEKVRLRNHIKYFHDTMQETQSVGKKLGFVAQEMGREINTLGSKSNHAEMQIIVVKMKDLLEQIKEQVLNVL